MYVLVITLLLGIALLHSFINLAGHKHGIFSIQTLQIEQFFNTIIIFTTDTNRPTGIVGE